jgi:6-phosphogluconolactonase (cycloisomerase 2 family)
VRTGRLFGVLAVALIVGCLIVVVGGSAHSEPSGVLFVESNQAQPGANSVLGFAMQSGDLRPLSIEETPTGGSGSTDLSDSGVLDADQQLLVDPSGKLLFAVNQGSDSIAVFRIEDHGDGYPSRPLVYINMPTVSKLAVYSVDPSGRLTFIRGVDNAGSVLPCWVLITRDGRFLYTANAGNDTVSAFSLSDPLHPHQLQTLTLKGKGNPWNLRFDPAQHFLFVNTPRATEVTPPGEGNSLHSLRIGDDGRLTELADSPVPVPVALGTQPIGLATVGR